MLGLVVVSRISGDFAAFAEAEDAFQRVLDGVQRTLSDLDRDLPAALAQWTGEAVDVYRVAYGQWHQAARDMADRLAGLHGVIAVSNRNFRSARAAGLRMWAER